MSQIILPDRDTWKRRAVRETGGNKTLMGCFVLAVLGYQHAFLPPRFGNKARIDEEGTLRTDMQDADYAIHRDHPLGSVVVVRDNFRSLADHLKLSDTDRVAMIDELKKWIAHDARANQTNEERGLTK